MNCDKEVYFDQYCKTCKHWLLNDADELCNECLDNPTNTESHKPVNYKPEEERKNDHYC